ncbi:hypothetical protein HWV62_26889 [Athelia sp. TMB]|nr:hypothetical protein HWV62_26889 [Athelia sp. TMB]
MASRSQTPVPISSDDNYTPELEAARVSASQGSLYSSPTSRNSEHRLAAVDAAMLRLYGGSKTCVITRSDMTVEAAHVVRRATNAEDLTLYEYCLGIDQYMLYLDSRRNLVFREHSKLYVFLTATRLMLDDLVKADWHGSFDHKKWLFLPDAAALDEAHHYVTDVLFWRKHPGSMRVQDFYMKWPVSGSHDYRFIPIAGLEREPITRERVLYDYPYRSFPTISCHITPLFAIIDAGIKLQNHNLRDLAVSYSEDNEEQAELERKLNIVHKIWALFTGAKSAAQNWSKSLKRPRDADDAEKSSCSSRYTTRSLPRTSGGNTDYGKGSARRGRSASKRSSAGGSGRQPESPDSRNKKRRRGDSGSESTLTVNAVLRLHKGYEGEHPQKRIRRWLAGQEREV